MTRPQTEPSQDQLLAMAYADGELSSSDRAAFEARLALEPALGREVATYKALELATRAMAPREPADHEWARLALDPLQRTSLSAGWALLVVGVGGLALFGIVGLVRHPTLELLPKALCLAGIGGATILLLVTVRERIATMPFDPYDKVER